MNFLGSVSMMLKILVMWIIELTYEAPHKLIIHLELDALNSVLNDKNYYGKVETWL
jgi:hypothetical protein